MLPILLPIGVALLGGLAYHASGKKSATASSSVGAENAGAFTPERAIVYETALNKLEDSTKLRALAAVFRGQGLEAQAVMLEKRARLRELPPEVKAKRREIFKLAMSSKNREGILKVAAAYDHEGATGAADHLRTYAAGLAA